MTTWVERSIDTAIEISRQTLTLSTASIALSVTFLTDVVDDSPNVIGLLGISWGVFVFSIICSIWTLMSITGIQAAASQDEVPDIYKFSVTIPAGLQILGFLGGLILTAVSVYIALASGS